MSFWNDHLNETNQTYWKHFNFAWIYGFKLLYAAIASFIHGVFPWWFKFYSAREVVRIYKVVKVRGTPGELVDE